MQFKPKFISFVVVAAIGGVVAYRADSTVRAAIAQAMSVFSASLAIGVVLLYVGPRFKETYIGFGVELPGLTVWAIHVVDLSLTYAPFVLLNLVGSSILGVVLLAEVLELVFIAFIGNGIIDSLAIGGHFKGADAVFDASDG